MVYTPVTSGLYTPALLFKRWPFGIHPCYFRALYTQHRHIQFPKSAGVISGLTDQLTEHSCFRDDHASPQA